MIGQDLISYCRVSTSRQGRSGLGLEGQQQAIARFAEAEGCIIRQELIEHIARWVFRCTVVIFHVTEQQVTEVALAEYNNVVKAFPSDRADQPFSTSILPRGGAATWVDRDAYRSESADKNLTISAVPVTNEIAGSLLPPACFRDLICDPFCGWIRCDAKP